MVETFGQLRFGNVVEGNLRAGNVMTEEENVTAARHRRRECHCVMAEGNAKDDGRKQIQKGRKRGGREGKGTS